MLTHVALKLIWLRCLLTKLKVQIKVSQVIWCDNQGVTSLATNLVYYAQTKIFRFIMLKQRFFKRRYALCTFDRLDSQCFY